MIPYFIFIATFFIVIGLFFLVLDLRWKQRMGDLETVFKNLDLPQIDIEDMHRIPFS